MKLKTIDVGGVTYAAVADGKPVYIHDDGKEIPFDAPATLETIGKRNKEAQTNRERYEAAEAKLVPFADITDPAAAVAALKTVKNLDDKTLVAAGEVEKVKAEAIKAVTDQYAPIKAERDALQLRLVDMKIGGAFNGSDYIGKNIAVPADMMRSTFGSRFRVEGDNIVGLAQDGNPLFSRTAPGSHANFEEAIEMMVSAYPYKDTILKGSNASGGGAQSGRTTTAGGKPSVTRGVFDAMSPGDRMAHIKAGGVTTE